MIFNALQNTHYCTSITQKALITEQLQALRREGLETVQDLVAFKQDELKVAFRNARTRIPDTPAIPVVPAIPAVMQDGEGIQASVPAIAGAPGIAAINPVSIPARSTTRLFIASVVFHY